MKARFPVGLPVMLIAALFALLLLAGCTSTPTAASENATAAPTASAAGSNQSLVIATTTSLYDTGLLSYLQPKFESSITPNS